MKFVCIGNPVFDYIKTPRVDTQTRILSGCSTNACLAAAKLGVETLLVGRVGGDFALSLSDGLQAYGVEACISRSEETGGFSLIYYDELGNRTLDVLGQAGPIDGIPEDAVSAADGVIIGPILGETPLALIRRVRDTAHGAILLDPQGLLRRIDDGGRIEHFRNPEIDTIIPLCDIVKANEVEARIITGIDPRQSEADLREATERLHAMGCRIAIVTVAAEGSAAFDGQTYTRIPAYHTDALDPTGAGDTYAAGFLTKYLETESVGQAGYYGSCVSSVMVENVGPDFPLTRSVADGRFEELFSDDDE